jgi:hypothetical protein
MDGPAREIGRGRLFIPDAEAHSERFGLIGLKDPVRHALIGLSMDGIAVDDSATLTATLFPTHGTSTPGFEYATYLLGAGAVTTDAECSGGTAYLVGLHPADGRQAHWLNGRTLSRLEGQPVRLDLRPGMTFCGCGGLGLDTRPTETAAVLA